MKKLLSVMAMFLMAAVVAFPPAAHALATLSLWDGFAPPVVIADGAALDANPLLGAVTYVGPVGGVFLVNVTTGITKPILGGASHASMDLNSVDVSSVGGGLLTIAFSEIGYNIGAPPTVPNSIATMSIGGTTQGTVTYQAYFDNANVLFGMPGAGLIGTLGPYTPIPPNVAFSGSLTTNITTIAAPGLYSLTEFFTIAHGAGVRTTSFNAPLDVVPLPATALLLGSGLLGLAALGWRRVSKAGR